MNWYNAVPGNVSSLGAKVGKPSTHCKVGAGFLGRIDGREKASPCCGRRDDGREAIGYG